jgi:hypothetical protein
MRKKLITLVALVFTFALAAVAFSAAPAGAAPPSPGACNMLNANKEHGLAGMDGAAAQGRQNMLDLVLASEAVNPPPDCPPLP